MKKKKKYQFFSVHTLTGTVFVIAVSYLISFVAQSIDFFNPIETALKDFTFTDVVFQKQVDATTGAETRFNTKQISDKIVLVNFGGPSLGRAGLAAELERINKFEPAVVGIDAFFRKPGADPYADSLLSEACRKTKNLVLVSKLENWDSVKNRFNDLTLSADIFSRYAESGFANLITGGEEGYLTTREYTSRQNIDSTIEWCFTGKILSLYDNKKFKTLIDRNAPKEVINFAGNYDHFFRLDYTDILDTTKDLSFLKGKIVLMGYLGEQLGEPSLTDVFFTPLNSEMAGRSIPDMYGIVVHANILSMMLGEYYITATPSWFDPLLAILVCMLNVSIFLYIGHKFKNSSQLMMRLVQIVQAIVMAGLVIYLLSEKDIYVEFTLSLTLLFLAADLTEIYEGSVHSTIELYKTRFGRKRLNARSRYYKKRRLFSK